ncbi:MAG: pyridoxal-phosphate dependent enzyme, partial [Clostridia bacterium]|nr:pyridoxal-phosphate dependent enzyme [Clostridia bacterium]
YLPLLSRRQRELCIRVWIKDADIVVVPVGGGGLVSGVAFAIKSLNPKVRVYGVQSAGAPSMLNSLEHHKIETLPSVSTVADGIAVKEPGHITFDICSKYVDGVVSVTDDQVSAAILALIEKQKMIAEGAGAVSLAAVMFGKIPDIKDKKVVCLISGGNIDVTILSRVISRGLLMSGRKCSLTLELMDKPGQLVGVSEIIAGCGGNVTAVLHERTNEGSAINGCYLKLQIETKDFEHIKLIKDALTEKGFKVLK